MVACVLTKSLRPRQRANWSSQGATVAAAFFLHRPSGGKLVPATQGNPRKGSNCVASFVSVIPIERPFMAYISDRVAGALNLPFRQLFQWRLQRYLDRRLQCFAALTGLTPQEKDVLLPSVRRYETALSRTDVWQELFSLLMVLPWAIFFSALLFVWLVDLVELQFEAGPGAIYILFYFTGLVLTWFGIRRVFPPSQPEPVGTRYFRQRPGRIIIGIVLSLGTGLGGFALGNAGFDRLFDGGLLTYGGALFYGLGLGMLVGSVAVGMWMVIRFVMVLAQWVLEHLEKLRNPDALLVDNQLAILRSLEELQTREAYLLGDLRRKRELINLLETAAQCLDQGLRRQMPTHDPETDRWMKNETIEMAAAIRRLKTDVMTPGPDSHARLYGQIRESFKCVTIGNWQHLPRFPRADIVPVPRRAVLIRMLLTIAVVALPVVLAASLTGLTDRGDKTSKPAGPGEDLTTSTSGGANQEGKKGLLSDSRNADGGGKATQTVRDWDQYIQVSAGLIASLILLMTRLDDLSVRLSYVRRGPPTPRADDSNRHDLESPRRGADAAAT